MCQIYRICPPGRQRVKDAVREAAQAGCKLTARRATLVMIPLKAANQDRPEAA